MSSIFKTWCVSPAKEQPFSPLCRVCSAPAGLKGQKWTQKHSVHQCPWSGREETPSTVVQAPPTLHLLGNSPIQTGVLSMGDFIKWLMACCLVTKDGLPEELGVWQPRGGWEEPIARNYWTEQCHILVKDRAAHHTRAITLEGDNMPSTMPVAYRNV